jgi:polyisoprenoid-binding protein YceI
MTMKLRSLLVLTGLAVSLTASVRAAVETYSIDPVHSSIGFSLRHFVAKVPGTFTKFTGTLTLDRADLSKSSAEATIEVGSVSSANDKRDEHLRAADFFNVAQFPSASFKSTAWKKTGENTYAISGNLTVRGVTKPVVLNATLLGFGDGMGGAKLVGWEATTTLNRKDFGVSGPAMLGAALGDEVTLTIAIEAGLKK